DWSSDVCSSDLGKYHHHSAFSRRCRRCIAISLVHLCFLRRVRGLLENIPDRICLAAYRYFPEETDVSNPFGADRPLRCFALLSEAVLHTAAVWRLSGQSRVRSPSSA